MEDMNIIVEAWSKRDCKRKLKAKIAEAKELSSADVLYEDVALHDCGSWVGRAYIIPKKKVML